MSRPSSRSAKTLYRATKSAPLGRVKPLGGRSSLSTDNDSRSWRRFSMENDSRSTRFRSTSVRREAVDNDIGDDHHGVRYPYLILLVIFLLYLTLLLLVYNSFPELEASEKKHLKLPWNMKDAKALAKVLDRYKETNFWTVVVGFALVYLFLQSFAIPGSIFLSIMSGFLFPFWGALFLICFCSATGASCCYLLSFLVAGNLVRTRFANEIRQWTDKVNEQGDHLLNFIIFLRITPILPNWIINIVSPHIGVPLKIFWLGTFLGVAPPMALAVQAGSTLNSMATPTEHISWTSILLLGVLAFACMIPVMLDRE